jgi:hypothetical protein
VARSDKDVRYQKAAYAALDQIDWCVEYLRRIRKAELSRQLGKHTTAIRRVESRQDEVVTRQQAG